MEVAPLIGIPLIGMLIPILFFLFFLVIGVGGTVLWVWMIIDCATNEPTDGNEKLVWILIIVLTHWVGALIYFYLRRPQRIQQYGR